MLVRKGAFLAFATECQDQERQKFLHRKVFYPDKEIIAKIKVNVKISFCDFLHDLGVHA